MLRNLITAFKFPTLFVARLLYRLFMGLPMKENTILFSSFEGNACTCNPKHLYQYIREHCGDRYRCVWVVKAGVSAPECEATVRFLSIQHIVALATSRWIITNLGIEPFFTCRKGQIVVNTWHGGGAYKNSTLGTQIKTSLYREYARKVRAENTTYYLSSCRLFTEFLGDAWQESPAKFLTVGSPRDDLFFRSDTIIKREKILKSLNLSEENKYLLYAPTFRGDWNGLNMKLNNLHLDVKRLLATLEMRFGGKFQLLFHQHICTTGWSPEGKNIIDVSQHPDIQELMLVADVFMTDYSSCVWDWAQLKKPGFLFTPDIDSYDKERGFYTPVETWAFPYARTNEELEKLVLSYDETRARRKISEHLERLGSYEVGKASEMTAQKIGLIF